MKEIDGATIIEPNDCIQVIKGQDIGSLGIVLSTQNSELLCWGRTPSGVAVGASSYTFKTQSHLCMCIGKGRIRPKSKAEEQEQQAVAAPAMPPAATRTQSGSPTPPKPRTAPQPQPAPRPELPPASPRPSAQQFGGVDSDSLDLKPRPRNEEVNPELLKPAVFAGPNAREMHGKPQNPKALVGVDSQQEQLAQTQHQQPQQDGDQVNQGQIKKAKKIPRNRLMRKGSRKRVKRRTSLGIPVEGETENAPGSTAPAQTADGSPGQLPIG